MLQVTATRAPSFSQSVRLLPLHHVVIAQNSQVGSGARMAVITVTSPDLNHAMTMYEIVRQTQVSVPQAIDIRGVRFASSWLMQPRP